MARIINPKHVSIYGIGRTTALSLAAYLLYTIFQLNPEQVFLAGWFYFSTRYICRGPILHFLCCFAVSWAIDQEVEGLELLLSFNVLSLLLLIAQLAADAENKALLGQQDSDQCVIGKIDI